MTKALARVHSAELDGINARPIEVEVDLNVGLHSFNIVGLADKALNEARERVNSALKNSGVKPPNRENRKITINLAPADIKKTGSQYDLAIALGYLLATQQVKPFETGDKLFVGELALDGRLRPISGALNIAHMAAHAGFKYLFLPAHNANEAAVVENISVIPLASLLDAIDFLEERRAPQPHTYKPAPPQPRNAPDFSHVRGQDNAKRALTIAAAGGHNLLMIGPPGVGKSLLAQALVGILPKMELQESIEATKVWSAAGLDPQGLLNARPFRAPHQTATLPAVIGGGQDPKPGEISLAHRGILFLDEFPEFPRQVLEALRAPMEDGVVHVARAKTSLAFPAKFTLVAAMNPCPCGYYGDPEKECRCSAYDVIRYQKKISGPLLDRIDLQMKIPRVHLADLRAASPEKLVSPVIREAVEAARDRQRERFAAARLHITTNAEMNSQQTEKLIAIEPQGEQFLSTLDRARLSPRGYYRLLKTARTIADIETKEKVSAEHLAEAYSYRLRET